MRTIILFISLGIWASGFAQAGISLNQELRSHDGIKTRNYYRLIIQQAKQKDVLKGLEKRLESRTKKEVVAVKNTLKIEKVVYKDLGSDSLEILAEVVELEDATMCYFAIDIDTLTVSAKTHPELDIKIKKYIRRFGLEMYLDALDDEMEREQKHLRSIEKELRSAYSESDKCENRIKENTVKIELNEEDQVVNKGNRKSKLAEIEKQKVQLAAVPSSNEELEAAEKEKLSNLQSEYKKLKSEYKKMQSKVSNMEQDIRNQELKKEKSDMHADSVKLRLSDQNLVIEKVRAKQYDAKKALNSIN